MPDGPRFGAWLTVREDNKEAVDLYKKLGFVRTGRASNGRRGGIRMKAPLEDLVPFGQSHSSSR